VLRYYEEEYQDDEYYRDRRLEYVAAQHAERLRIMQGIDPTPTSVVKFDECMHCSYDSYKCHSAL
jgi:hypothetical protein